MRTLTSLLVSAVLTATAVDPGAAQVGSVGIDAGVVQSHQVRDRAADSGARRGFLAGVYADAPMPVRWLSLLVEAAWVRRGAVYELALQGSGTLANLNAETDYVSFTLAPTLRLGLGPASIFVYGGPASDLHLRTRSVSTLRSMLAEPSSQTLAIVGGVGLEGRLPGGRAIRVEVRTNRGVTAAYTPADGDIRYRSTELIVRFGLRPFA